jgi:hypothetical protein
VTLIVYVLVVVPFSAVTTMLIEVAWPGVSEIGLEATPELTAVPLTEIVAFALCAVAVTETDETSYDTRTENDALASSNRGSRLPADKLKADRAASRDVITAIGFTQATRTDISDAKIETTPLTFTRAIPRLLLLKAGIA